MTTIRSVARASRILVQLGEQPDGRTAKEVAVALELPLPTTYHLLGTLVAEGFVTKDSRRRYRLGPALSTHPRFPAGTNVEFAVVESKSRVRILIWERGVGPTLASGTGACASAIAAIAHGGADRDVEVIAPGGSQRVEWRDDGIYLTGWAEVVFEGRWVPAHADFA